MSEPTTAPAPIPTVWSLDAVHELLRRAGCDAGDAEVIFEAGQELFDGGSVIAYAETAERSARDSLLAPLSPREREVVDLLATGLRLSVVARKLGVTQHTARNHLKHAFKKTGTHSQNELIARLGGRHG